MGKPSDADLGARIATLREQRGWSQRALAKLLGMNQSILSRIEAGKRRVSATELEQLAAVLDVDLRAFLSDGATPSASRSPYPRSRLAFSSAPRSGAPPVDDAPAARLAPPARRSAPRPYASRQKVPTRLASSAGAGEDLDAALRTESHRAARVVDDRAAGEPPFTYALGHEQPLAKTLRPPRPPAHALPPPADTVIDDYLRLRDLAESEEGPWASSIRSSDAMGRRTASGPSPWSPPVHVGVSQARDRYARFLRHELGVGVDGPVPDLVTLFEDARVAEVVVARSAGESPVAANVSIGDDAAFVFVNAARPVALQRFALVHSVAHVVLGHGDVVDERIVWSRAEPLESEANDFAEEFLAPVAAVARWYERHGDPRPSVDVLLEIAAAFGVTPWSALYRSRAADRLNPKLQSVLTRELRTREWGLLPEQALRGGLRDTLSSLGEEAPPPAPGARGASGAPAPAHLTREPGPAIVLRVPARMRTWALRAVREGRLSLEEAARMLHLPPADLAGVLRHLGVE